MNPRTVMNRLQTRWRGLSEDARGFLVMGGIVAGILGSMLVYNYGATVTESVTATLTPETVGERLRRECTSIVTEAYPGISESQPARERNLVATCILERGSAGR